MSKTLSNQMGEWNEINWRKLEKNVYKLQKRIFQASTRGDTSSVRRLQKTLMRSWSGKALSVRKVTQDNQGKKTAGVDGIKSLTHIPHKICRRLCDSCQRKSSNQRNKRASHKVVSKNGAGIKS